MCTYIQLFGGASGADAKSDGIRVKTSSYSRHHINSTMIHAKASGHYVNSVVANHEAVQQGYSEALMLDTQGYAAEGSTFFTGTAAEIPPIRELDNRTIGMGGPGPSV